MCGIERDEAPALKWCVSRKCAGEFACQFPRVVAASKRIVRAQKGGAQAERTCGASDPRICHNAIDAESLSLLGVVDGVWWVGKAKLLSEAMKCRWGIGGGEECGGRACGNECGGHARMMW